MGSHLELRLAKERLVSGDSQIEGLGVFAQMGFRTGDLICIMQGRKVTVQELKSLYDSRALRLSDPLQISERGYLVIEPPFLHINHSCDPNSAIIGESQLVALRSIDKGEELTFDYSSTEWTWEKFGRHAKWDMQCKCGSPKCEGYVTQFPQMPLARKTDYFRRGALPDHVVRKIIKAGLNYKGS